MNLKEKSKIFEIEFSEDQKLELEKNFGNQNPVYWEIGSGRGEFILKKAAENPHINFLGIDSKEKRLKTILRKLDVNIHRNIRLLRILLDNENLEIFPEDFFSRIFILHPDPWPKRKHHRRRLINQEFLNRISKKLIENGIIELATDHSDYAEWIIRHFEKNSNFLSCYEKGFSQVPPRDHIPTYFGKKKQAEGFQPLYMKYKRIL